MRCFSAEGVLPLQRVLSGDQLDSRLGQGRTLSLGSLLPTSPDHRSGRLERCADGHADHLLQKRQEV